LASNEDIADLASTGNPLIRKPFEDAMKKHCSDLMGREVEKIEMGRLRKAGR
jgi:hypothetical protein